MAEVLLSAIMEQLAFILRRQAEGRIGLVLGVEEEVQKLNSNFQAIRALLNDAERRQVMDDSVRDWLDKLKDTSYDIDDVLDEWNIEIQKLRIMEVERSSNAIKKVCSLISNCYLCCRQVVAHREIALKIKSLNQRLDVITLEKDRFNFRFIKGTEELEREITTSVVDVSEIYGRSHEKNSIINLLLSESSIGSTFLPIISIVGLGGIGKTTLARLVFNDDEVKAQFDKRIWVCISDPFDEIRIAKAILESFTNVAPNVNEYETMLNSIQEFVKEKKVLLVLDDVWTEVANKWEQLKNALKCSSRESRILVTTRKINVAMVIGTTNFIQLKMLSDDNCWPLFSQLAFFGKSSTKCRILENIGRRIVGKCKGLPLAVKTLGSLLRLKNKVEDWQDVLDSEMWKLEEVEKGIFPPLLLSYYDLPFVLKKCFSYCAIFPKDYLIEKKKLIKLWMAQDYLGTNQSKDLELFGERCFENLVMRSFFQDFERNEQDKGIIRCKMHDIVHDFAQFLAKNECLTIKLDGYEESRSESLFKARHAMICNEGEQCSASIYDKTKLRSLLSGGGRCFGSESNLTKVFDQLTCLRSLGLTDSSLWILPRDINKLIHLKYLELSNTNIEDLPETLCELYNLQTLDLSDCRELVKLPGGLRKLLKLRHLINYNTRFLLYMPKIERLTSLRTLNKVVLPGSKNSCTFECLRYLNHLRGSLYVQCLNCMDVGEIKYAEFKNKIHLVGMTLDFFLVRKAEAIEAFEPPPNLEELEIRSHYGQQISLNWMMSLTKLRKLRLLNSAMQLHSLGELLLPLGKLSLLESLYIHNFVSVKKVANAFVGIESDNMSSSSSSLSLPLIAFPKLQELVFDSMPKWEEWNYATTRRGGEEIIIMPCLRSLKMNSCLRLKSLPDYILQLTTLEELSVSQSTMLEELYQVEKAEDSGVSKCRIYPRPPLNDDNGTTISANN